MDSNFSLINKHIARVLEMSLKMNQETGIHQKMINELSGTQIEYFTGLETLKTLVKQINKLEQEYKDAKGVGYRESLFLLTTSLQYSLEVDGLWEIAKRGVVRAIENNSVLTSIMETQKAGNANLGLLTKYQGDVNVDNFKGENWLISYCLMAIYLSNPLNLIPKE